MFKTAPRYLSGVSVFLGDDITRRSTEGELAFFIGQAVKGTNQPIVLNSVEAAVNVFGSDCPLSKAICEFWDGYLDSPQSVPVRLVAYRVGGIKASLVTSFGLTFEINDPYTGAEEDYYLYIDNREASKTVKIWNKQKTLVYNSKTGINVGYVTVTGELDGLGGVYGKDLDNDINATPVTLKAISDLDVVAPDDVTATTVSPVGPITPDATSLVLVGEDASIDAALEADGGRVSLSVIVGAKTYTKVVKYSAYDSATNTLTIDGTEFPASDVFTQIPVDAVVEVKVVSSSLVEGDSELDITKKELYEKMRKSLLEIEQFTPDYIIPGGVTIDETDVIPQQFDEATLLTSAIGEDGATVAIVDAAALWPQSGIITIDQGIVGQVDKVRYTQIEVSGEDYELTLENPTFVLEADATIGDSSITVVTDGSASVDKLTDQGYVDIGGTLYHYTINVVGSTESVKQLDITPTLAAGAVANDPVLKKVKAASVVGTDISTEWVQNVSLPLGIGYVKETEAGGDIIFEWSASGKKEAGYNLAHFGYLFAKFCNDAALGYNIPLCGINTKLPKTTNRAGVYEWIGEFPDFYDVSGGIESVLVDGSGLLGDPAMVGSIDYNRCYLTDAASGTYADPAFGFLLTDEGFIDGTPIKDGYGNVVDLGKFMCAGAGVITFYNRASASAYNNTCGVYAIGMLAGVPRNEGISFKRIGSGSNASVSLIINRKYYNDLAKAGYIVLTREKGLGWVINNDPSCSREDSGYYLISTSRIIKTVVESKRSALVGFIGKPLNRYYFEAARTKIADSFKRDISLGYLNGYTFDLQVSEAARAIGKLYLKCSLNPPLELVQADIDTVIDRDVVSE